MKQLSSEEILQMLDGVEDILTPKIKQRDDFYQTVRCPVCGSTCTPSPHPNKPFVDGDPLPNTVARCTECAAAFDPHTGLLFEAGSATLIEPITADPGMSFRR